MIMIIAGRGGGGDHTPLGLFSMLQTQLFGSIKPQNKLCIKLEASILDYFQYKLPYRSCLFHLIPARYDHDHRFNGFFKPSITKVGFKHTQNVFQDIPESPN